MLRTAGPDVYDQWWRHEIPFNDDTVLAAGERFGEVMFGEGYVLGGAEATPDIAFGDAPGPMFESPPGCWLHRQATFINAFFPETAVAGVDYDWFPFPSIDEEGVLYGGEFTVVGTAANRPEVVDFLNAVHQPGSAVPDGWRGSVVACVAEHRRRSRLLRERHPRRRVGDLDGGVGGRHRSVRRIRPHARRGRERQLLDGHARVHG